MNDIRQQIKSGQLGEGGGGADDPDSRMDVERITDRRDKKGGGGSAASRIKLTKGGGGGSGSQQPQQSSSSGSAKGQGGKQGFWPK